MPALHSYLMKELKVEEVTPDSFARKITHTFLENQTDDWFVKFYEYLSGQEALWRTPRWSGEIGGLLREKPILRIENNEKGLVAPFDEKGHPNAYLPPEHPVSFPVVKRSIAKHKSSMDFLRRLGLNLPDEVIDVIENILPKYHKREHLDDKTYEIELQKIFRALKTDSQKQKQRLLEELKNTAFVKATNMESGIIALKKPGEVYICSEDIFIYLNGNPEAWVFFESDVSNETLSALMEIGVARMPRVIQFKPNKSEDELKKLRNGSKRTCKEELTDKRMDGLEFFIQHIASGDSSLKKSRCLWLLLTEIYENQGNQHISWIDGSYPIKLFRGEYKYTKSNTITPFESEACRLLKSYSWLATKDDSLKKPSDICRDEIHPDLKPNQLLCNALGINPSKERINEEKCRCYANYLEIPFETVQRIKQHPEDFVLKRKPEFPESPIPSLEHRHEKIVKQLSDAPVKKYDKLKRSVRVTKEATDQNLWLKELYTNGSGQMICQICKDEMPFKKQDGDYYFEAVEALSNDYFSREHEAQYLALCPLCAAMYKEFVKNKKKPEVMEKLYNELMNTDKPEVLLKLGKLETSLKFVEKHFSDITTILKSNRI
jgi:hypothetical protein